ncbi:MAG TPA: 3-deoxy-manno-octulosonate cytidylyltransferase [Sphingobacteriaceae bacterium]|nr:3-deoxy-manno-octulosonate cytidylyltransferase [Sphingobacteriaceae bacterium]
MKILGIIPARYASTRFPGKPLADIAGKSMIRRVYEQAMQAQKLTEVVVATDDVRILAHVNDFGGKAVLTSPDHQSGTDRCAEVADKLPGYDYAVNIQGDEPFIHPGQIDLLCSCFNDKDTVLATLVKQIHSDDDLINPNIPKVVLNSHSEAIYFSRTVIPHYRGKPLTEWLSYQTYFKHIGIYGYRTDILNTITQLPISVLEIAEALEQLRWIENGFQIKVAITDRETHAVDTPEDLEKILKNL